VAKIGDLGTARFLKPSNQAQLSRMSQLTKAPGTVDFMPPEVLFDNPQYGTPLDVFSFACVSLHTITHKWPTPTAPVYTDPRTNMLQPRSEAERRALFLDIFYEEALLFKPLLLHCLDNSPNARPCIIEVCNQLETLKGAKYQIPLPNILDASDDIDSDISQLQVSHENCDQSAVKYWECLEKVWEISTDLPREEVVDNITLVDGKVYVAGNNRVFCFSLREASWSILPPLPVNDYSLACIAPTKQLIAIGGISRVGLSNKASIWDTAKRCWCNNIITSRMKIARCGATAVGHHSSVIVIGGMINPIESTTESVEVLRINPDALNESHWYIVQSIPFGVFRPMTSIINDKLYVAGGYMKETAVTHMTSTSLPILLSSNSSTPNVWSDISHLPCTTASFTSYEDQLLVFGGDYLHSISKNENFWKTVPSIYLYHSKRKQWEAVDEIPYNYFLGRCVHLTPSKIMFFGGLADPSSTKSCVSQCLALELTNC